MLSSMSMRRLKRISLDVDLDRMCLSGFLGVCFELSPDPAGEKWGKLTISS